VSRRVRTRAMLVQVSQRVRGERSIPAFTAPLRKRHNWPSIPSTSVETLRMAGCGGRCEALGRVVHSLSTFAVGNTASDRLRFYCRVAASASLYRRLSDRCLPRAPILQYFPCSPSVTRFGAYPAPGGTSMFCFALRAPYGSGFPKKKSPCGCGPYGRDFFFGASQKAHLGTWERGTLASLRARVSRG
jgi:hypothetical protein